MSRRNKLAKFEDLLQMDNVFQNFSATEPKLVGKNKIPIDLKGKWNSVFNNNNPIVLELACGRGEYTLAMARDYPETNFIGVDIKGARIWKGANQAKDENLENVAFLRTKIELIDHFFGENEISEIWITFPDPFPKKENRRLTSKRFFDRYQKILKSGEYVLLKTDATEFYEFTLEVAEELGYTDVDYYNDDIYNDSLVDPRLEYKTYYEALHLGKGKKIKFTKIKVGK